MRNRALFITASLLALAACSDSKTETDKAGGTSVSVDIDSSKSADSGGKVEISLPGGVAAKVSVPEGLGDASKIDIDGVGLYPGAKVRSVKVNASDTATKRAVVQIGFTAPGDAAAVADWYQQQFDAKTMKVTRNGETLTGKTEDGDDFTVALTAAGAGQANGLVTLVNAKG